MLDVAGLGLKQGDLVVLDAGPFIYLVEQPDSDRGAVARFFVESALAGDIRLAVSAAAWTECLAGPIAAGSPDKAAAFRRLLSDTRTIVPEPVDAAIAEEAARLMALPVRVGFADALHLATAAVARAAAVLTNDEDWKAIVDAAGRMEPRRTSTYRTMRILVVDELAFDL